MQDGTSYGATLLDFPLKNGIYLRSRPLAEVMTELGFAVALEAFKHRVECRVDFSLQASQYDYT